MKNKPLTHKIGSNTKITYLKWAGRIHLEIDMPSKSLQKLGYIVCTLVPVVVSAAYYLSHYMK